MKVKTKFSEKFRVILIIKNYFLLDLVHSFTLGLNGTIFAYGQTGAGKTYSIIGGDSTFADLKVKKQQSTAGILPRAL
jgi:hypothetical protein